MAIVILKFQTQKQISKPTKQWSSNEFENLQVNKDKSSFKNFHIMKSKAIRKDEVAKDDRAYQAPTKFSTKIHSSLELKLPDCQSKHPEYIQITSENVLMFETLPENTQKKTQEYLPEHLLTDFLFK